jgi:hypothetical protein
MQIQKTRFYNKEKKTAIRRTLFLRLKMKTTSDPKGEGSHLKLTLFLKADGQIFHLGSHEIRADGSTAERRIFFFS